ncbi:hypothetical protein RvY_09469 [Ramazzottius varieornatus]|uniref:Uncharacterized protein n=1 Tax=Ramazzottius varieornatus TaxID=947166 RepID=A0A1D1VBW4_RAMVA|nr:hypothetical protein RvY_09469 [Ramazzottius varieornatus]
MTPLSINVGGYLGLLNTLHVSRHEADCYSESEACTLGVESPRNVDDPVQMWDFFRTQQSAQRARLMIDREAAD